MKKILTSSGLRIALTLIVALFVAIKFPEGKQIACSTADVLAIKIDLCEE